MVCKKSSGETGFKRKRKMFPRSSDRINVIIFLFYLNWNLDIAYEFLTGLFHPSHYIIFYKGWIWFIIGEFVLFGTGFWVLFNYLIYSDIFFGLSDYLLLYYISFNKLFHVTIISIMTFLLINSMLISWMIIYAINSAHIMLSIFKKKIFLRDFAIFPIMRNTTM